MLLIPSHKAIALVVACISLCVFATPTSVPGSELVARGPPDIRSSGGAQLQRRQFTRRHGHHHHGHHRHGHHRHHAGGGQPPADPAAPVGNPSDDGAGGAATDAGVPPTRRSFEDDGLESLQRRRHGHRHGRHHRRHPQHQQPSDAAVGGAPPAAGDASAAAGDGASDGGAVSTQVVSRSLGDDESESLFRRRRGGRGGRGRGNSGRNSHPMGEDDSAREGPDGGLTRRYTGKTFFDKKADKKRKDLLAHARQQHKRSFDGDDMEPLDRRMNFLGLSIHRAHKGAFSAPQDAGYAGDAQ